MNHCFTEHLQPSAFCCYVCGYKEAELLIATPQCNRNISQINCSPKRFRVNLSFVVYFLLCLILGRKCTNCLQSGGEMESGRAGPLPEEVRETSIVEDFLSL